MTSTINVTAVLIANAMGVLLLLFVGSGNRFVLKEQTKRNRCLIAIALINILSCVIDGIVCVADGRPGALAHDIIFWGNSILYLNALLMAILWILLVADYIKIKLSTAHKVIMASFFTLVVILLITNIFTPILFFVNEDNLYVRVDGLYAIYAASYFGFMLDGVAMYLWKRHQSGGLKFFPIWAFVIPIAIGMIIQNTFFGVSTIGPFMSIAITAVAISFQNNFLFRDQLTDLYNRYYLAMLGKTISQRPGREYTVIMFDINDFKSINDTYGHGVGDEALVRLSNILTTTVDKTGEVIRYAGDEFVILLNSHDDAVIEGFIARIHQALDELGSAEDAQYKISVATGWHKFHLEGKGNLNEYIGEADKRMYADKQEYYKACARCGCCQD